MSRNIVENYIENRLIYDELNHYKKNKSILGIHPIFAWVKRIDQIRSLKIGELVNLKIRLENNLVKNKKKIRTEKGHPLAIKRVERVDQMERELIEVNRLLNL